MQVNREQLSQILGVSKPTITSWLDDGLPAVIVGGRGKEWVFETVEVLAWWAGTKFKSPKSASRQRMNDPFGEETTPGRETIEDAQLRKESALADRHEITAAREAGLLVPIDEVQQIVTDENLRVRARLLSLPNEMRPFLLTHLHNDKKAVEHAVAKIELTVHEALAEVRSYAQGASDDA